MVDFQRMPVLDDPFIDLRIENCRNDQEVVDSCIDADGIIVAFYPIGRNIIEKLDRCKVIVRYGIGYDSVDIGAATEKGIVVCNIPDYCFPEVATHAMALILNAIRRITRFDRLVRNGKWEIELGNGIHRLSEMTLGIVGFGNIARQVAAYAKGFGFRMMTFDPYVTDKVCMECGVEQVSLETLLKMSDIVTLHVPSTEQTKHMINRDTIRLMKQDAILVNTSRGTLIDEKDLLIALKEGAFGAVCLDVLEKEPMTAENRDLLLYDRVTVTPHLSYVSEESKQSLMLKAQETLSLCLQGKRVRNIVNKDVLISG
jgi:Phosphoglycerate dehydrogenase and related dehydrogenases